MDDNTFDPLQKFNAMFNGDCVSPILCDKGNEAILSVSEDTRKVKEQFEKHQSLQALLYAGSQNSWDVECRYLKVTLPAPAEPATIPLKTTLKVYGIETHFVVRPEETNDIVFSIRINSLSQMLKLPREIRNTILEAKATPTPINVDVKIDSVEIEHSVGQLATPREMKQLLLEGIKGCCSDNPTQNDTLYLERSTTRRKRSAGGAAEILSIWCRAGINKQANIGELKRSVELAPMDDLGIDNVDNLAFLIWIAPRAFCDMAVRIGNRPRICGFEQFATNKLNELQQAGIIRDKGNITKQEYLAIIVHLGGRRPNKLAFRSPRKKADG